MSGLELPAFVVGVAGLFSSSVDAFSYFKAAQNADEDVDTVLLKLDVEKTRLLLWANEIGMFSVKQQHPQLLDEAVVDLISRILKKVITKLTDSEQLRASYGVVNLDVPRAKTVDYLSSNGFEIFRRSSHRFWTRYASKLRPHRAPGEGSMLTKTKWAIYEKEKFQALVNDVKDFVDNLYEFIPVNKETQMHVIQADIESILDLSHLKLVESATEDSYRVYSEIAGSVIEASKSGTVDRRTVEEYIRDAESFNRETSSSHTPNSDVSAYLDDMFVELQFCSVNMVLTSICHKINTPNPCNVLQLGEHTGSWRSNNYPPNWGVTPDMEHEYALWNLLKNVTNATSEIKEAFEDHRSEIMACIIKNEDHSGVAEAFLPLVTILIYCSPCACHVHTALDISSRLKSRYVRVQIRPDDRIKSSCCQIADRVAGLRSILNYVDEREAEGVRSWEGITIHLDRVWVGRRLEAFEYEQPYKYTENSGAKVILIGETDYLQPLLLKAPGRIPKSGEIWTMKPVYSNAQRSYERTFRHRFVEKKHPIVKVTPVTQHLTPVSYTTSTETAGSKRALSSISTESKRQKLSDASEAEDSGEDITSTPVSSSRSRTE